MIAVVLPTLDTPGPLARVLGELPDGLLAIVVDDGSVVPASGSRPHTQWIRHERNRGYGAAQKSGYAAAIAAGATQVVLLHGDGQYDTRATLALVDALADADAALGSRFLSDPSVIPTWRRLGNRLLTGVANLRFGTAFTELHTGARAYRIEALRGLPMAAYSDDFLFDQQVIVGLVREGRRVEERPVSTHYAAGSRSISFVRSLWYALGCLRVILA
ncbi:MAG: glycosyltransferase [Myxococcales bacterium]|nr:glycosyltransferase [Myxococcales bacterium]